MPEATAIRARHAVPAVARLTDIAIGQSAPGYTTHSIMGQIISAMTGTSIDAASGGKRIRLKSAKE